MKNPLVTISTPTFNSEKTIDRCLSGIKNQTYNNIEVNIIDGGSKDKTLAIAKKYNAKCKVFKGSLLAARYEGVKWARGKYTLIFDSDQILENNSIKTAVEMSEKGNFEMLVFEEDVYKADTFLEKLFACDRKLINTINDLSPFTGVIMPRFFRTEILKKAYGNIPRKYFSRTGGPDHAIVYYEAWRLSQRISTVPNAVKHIEPPDLFTLWRKFYKWGYTSIDAHYGKYGHLMKTKERFRTGLFTKGLLVESLGSIILLILKGLAFKLGYISAKLR